MQLIWERRVIKLLVNLLDDIILIDHNISYVKVKKKKKKQQKMVRRLNRHFSREDRQGAKKHLKRLFNITDYQRNENQNYSEI